MEIRGWRGGVAVFERGCCVVMDVFEDSTSAFRQGSFFFFFSLTQIASFFGV